MADISDDEQIEKPKRVLSDKQKEALKKGRELSRMNREAAKKAAAPELVEQVAVEPIMVEKTKRSRKKKAPIEPLPEPEPVPEPVPEPQPKARRQRKQKIPEPEPEPEPPARPSMKRVRQVQPPKRLMVVV